MFLVYSVVYTVDLYLITFKIVKLCSFLKLHSSKSKKQITAKDVLHLKERNT